MNRRAFGEHGIEVRRDRDERPAAPAGADAHDVAFLVALDVGEAEPAQAREKGDAARVFLERRRGDFSELDSLGDQAVVIGIEGRQGGLELRV